jgi:hypothetical protein
MPDGYQNAYFENRFKDLRSKWPTLSIYEKFEQTVVGILTTYRGRGHEKYQGAITKQKPFAKQQPFSW